MPRSLSWGLWPFKFDKSPVSSKRNGHHLGGIHMKFKWFFFFLILLLILPPFSASQTRDSGKLYKVAILPFVINSQ
jgi:hypothetical protein